MKNLNCVLGIAFVLILSLGFASASILVAGKVYTANFTETVAGANLTVTCDDKSFSTLSLGDGSYSVVFESDECSYLEVESDYTVAQIVSEIGNPYEEIISESVELKKQEIITGAMIDIKNDAKDFFIDFWWIFAALGSLGIIFVFAKRRMKKI